MANRAGTRASTHLFRGFTLVELMVAVVVAAILTAIAFPNFRDFMRRNNVTAHSNSLLADLQYARNEAISQRALISICPRPAGVSDGDTSCVAGGGANFDNGWLVYKATTAHAVYDGSAGQMLLRSSPPPRTVSVRASAATIPTIDARGELVSEDAGHQFLVCYKSSPGSAEVGENTTAVPGSRLTIASSGRVNVQALAAGAACN